MVSRFNVIIYFLLVLVRYKEVKSYSKVLTMGSGNSENGPQIYKAMNMDLIFPKTFNSSEKVISTTQTILPQRFSEPAEFLLSTTDEQFTPGYSSLQTSSTEKVAEPTEETTTTSTTTATPTNHYHPSFVIANNHADNFEEENEAALPPPATGRAVDYHPAYPFSQLLTPNSKGYSPSAQRSRPVSKSGTGQQRVVYPSYQASRIPSRAEIDKLSGKGQFSDRFTPAEGVASNTFKLKQNRMPSLSRPIGQTSNKVSSFLPNQDLYAFPPNINSRYPLPSETKQASPSDTITSYLPPAAGPLDNTQFVGPINPDLLPDNMKKSSKDDTSGGGYEYSPSKAQKEEEEKTNGDSGYYYDPPKPPMDEIDSENDQVPPDVTADGDDRDTGVVPAVSDGTMDESASPVHHDHHDHHDIGAYVDGKEYPTPPPGYFEEHDHDHSHHYPDLDFSHGPVFHDHHSHDYPNIVFDDYHSHHIHHDHLPPMTTEPAPPPQPAPEQPRVKKYSYFYIGRKLWYIPLYFTVWFTFYVLWLILKSIARHKVNLPNHYVNRRSIDEREHREARESIDKLTVKVMDGIEKFKLRYIG